MDIKIMPDKAQMGKAAAAAGAEHIRRAIADRGAANIIVATGASQFEMLGQLVQEPGINWNHVTGFHLDEYVGLPISHPASFRRYLWERFVSRLPLPMRAFHFLDAEERPASRMPPRRRDHSQASDRRCLCRHRREWAPGLQRSAGRFRNRRALPGRGTRRRLPPATTGRGLVPHVRRRAEASDLDVRATDHEEPSDRLHGS